VLISSYIAGKPQVASLVATKGLSTIALNPPLVKDTNMPVSNGFDLHGQQVVVARVAAPGRPEVETEGKRQDQREAMNRSGTSNAAQAVAAASAAGADPRSHVTTSHSAIDSRISDDSSETEARAAAAATHRFLQTRVPADVPLRPSPSFEEAGRAAIEAMPTPARAPIRIRASHTSMAWHP